MKYFILLSFAFLAFACGTDEPATDEAATEYKTNQEVNEERLAQIAPPPPSCQSLTEADILSVLGSEVRMPMPAGRSVSMYNSCQYGIDGPFWNAILILEFPDDNRTMQTMRDEVAGAKGENKVMIRDNASRIMNEGRIIVVGAKVPYRVKFTVNPSPNKKEPFDETERRRLIVEFAEVVARTKG